MKHPAEAGAWPDGAALDRAMHAAFQEAVRQHRAENVPLVMWQDGEVRHVSPFDIPLPEDSPRLPPPLTPRS